MNRDEIRKERFGRVRHVLQEAHRESDWQELLLALLETEQTIDPEGYRTEWVPYIKSFSELWQAPFQCSKTLERIEEILHVMPWVKLDTNLDWRHLDDAMRLLESDHVSKLSSFKYYGAYPNHSPHSYMEFADHSDAQALCRAIAMAYNMTELNTLQVSAFTLGNRCCAHLASARHLKGITHLELRNNLIDARAAQALAASPVLANVKHLDLSQNALHDEGLIALSQSPYLTELRRLDLSSFNFITTRGIEALATSPTIRNLRDLGLRGAEVGDRGLEAIIESSWSASLITLGLSRTQLDANSALHIARATHMTSLEVLDLTNNPMSDEAAIALAQAPHLSGLKKLLIEPEHLSKKGALALLDAPYLHPRQRQALLDNLNSTD